jgi:type I restriction enzyme S subunit
MKFEPILKLAPFSGIRVKPFEGTKRYLSTGDLKENSISFVDISFKDKPSRADIIVQEGDVLFARMKDTKKVLRITQEFSGIIVSTGFAVLKPVKNCDPAYLATYLNTDYFERQKEKYSSGAIQPAITNLGIKKLQIPFPPINDQTRIAHLLGKVESLITQRKKNIQQLDVLSNNVFSDMFGDPVRNEKDWDKKSFGELLADIDSGKSPKCEARPAKEEEWGVLKLGAVTRCVFKQSENKALPEDILPVIKHEVRAGDLLFSRKNTYELVAACAYVFKARTKLLMPDLIFRFIFKEQAKVNPIYIWKLLINDSQRKSIQTLASGAAGSMPNISKANLKKTILPIPPLDLQNQFAKIVEKIEVIKYQYQQSLLDLEALYGSLSQKAFKGDLDLSLVLLDNNENSELDELLSHQVPDTPHDYQQYVKDALKNNPNQTMNSTEGRLAILRDLFFQYLNPSSNNSTLEEFWAYAQDTASDYSDLENDQSETSESISSFSLADYDLFKDWVFQQIRSNKFSQNFINDKNVVQLRVNT